MCSPVASLCVIVHVTGHASPPPPDPRSLVGMRMQVLGTYRGTGKWNVL